MVFSYRKQIFWSKKELYRIQKYYPDGNLKKEIYFDNGKEISCREYYDRNRIDITVKESTGPNGIPPLWDIRSIVDLFPPKLTGIKYYMTCSDFTEEYYFDENGRLSTADIIMMQFNENDDLEWAKEGEYEACLYYDDHLLQKIEYSRGDQVLLEYNDEYHISLITHNQSSGEDRAWKYLYDQKGRLKEKVYVYGEQESTEVFYSYY